MGSDAMQVGLDQVAATASQWQGLGAELTASTRINAMISADAAAFATRTQETTTGMSTAGATYSKHEATSAGEMAAVTKVTVV